MRVVELLHANCEEALAGIRVQLAPIGNLDDFAGNSGMFYGIDVIAPLGFVVIRRLQKALAVARFELAGFLATRFREIHFVAHNGFALRNSSELGRVCVITRPGIGFGCRVDQACAREQALCVEPVALLARGSAFDGRCRCGIDPRAHDRLAVAREAPAVFGLHPHVALRLFPVGGVGWFTCIRAIGHDLRGLQDIVRMSDFRWSEQSQAEHREHNNRHRSP